jgi:hypothetical protein
MITAQVRRTPSKRGQPVEWLIRLCHQARVLLAYAEPDPGLDYLNHQIAKGVGEQLPRPFTVQTYAGLGHLADEPSARTRLFRDIAKFFAELDREARPAGASVRRASF